MNMTMKHFMYWVKSGLEMLGISIGVSLLIMILQLGGSIDFSQDVMEVFLTQVAFFPYYMFFVTAFVVLMLGMGYFQVYFSTLISMNATRKEVAGGILGTVAVIVTIVILIAAAVWKIVPGDVASDGNRLLVLFAGILFFVAGISLVIGLTIVKWGRVGGIIFFILCVVIGGFAGACVGSGLFGDLVENIKTLLMKFDLWWTLAIGLVVYVLASVFIIINTRKMEVRV